MINYYGTMTPSNPKRNFAGVGSAVGDASSAAITSENAQKKPKTHNVTLVSDPENCPGEIYAIDRDDCIAVSEVLGCHRNSMSLCEALSRGIVNLGDCNEKRVIKLNIPKRCFVSPSIGQLENLEELNLSGAVTSNLRREIGNLAKLKTLNLSKSWIKSLPSFIGQLQNLEELNLGGAHTSSLPHEIGNLAKLKTLNLSGTSIDSLPPSTAQLQNLEELNLGRTKFSSLPHEIWSLAKLNALSLRWLEIRLLPPSIGQLQNLEKLDLSWTRRLSALPDEIGNLVKLRTLSLQWSGVSELPPSIGLLVKLKTLNLEASRISSLPPSIGQLQNLEKLDLSHKESLLALPMLALPNEVGSLAKLKSLDLRWSPIKSLPSCIGKLVSLETLGLSNPFIPSLPISIGSLTDLKLLLCGHGVLDFGSVSMDSVTARNALMVLVHKLPLLGVFDHPISFQSGSVDRKPRSVGWKRFDYTLACNRARSRMRFESTNQDYMQLLPKLWPLMVARATRAFEEYPEMSRCSYYDSKNLANYCISSTDAIYQFLAEGRESFVGLLLHPWA